MLKICYLLPDIDVKLFFMADPKRGAALGKMDVAKRAVRMEDLADKVGFAVKQFEAAQKKFEAGEDSYKEWENIIKLLSYEIRDIQHFQAVAHHNLAIIHAGRHEFHKAEELLQAALKLDPTYAMAWYNLAVVYKNLRIMDKARDCLARAKECGYSG